MGVSSPFCRMDSDNQTQSYILFSYFVPSSCFFTRSIFLALFWIDCFPMEFSCTSFEVECSVFIFHAHLHQQSKPKFPVLPPVQHESSFRMSDFLLNLEIQNFSFTLFDSPLSPCSVLHTVCSNTAVYVESCQGEVAGWQLFSSSPSFLVASEMTPVHVISTPWSSLGDFQDSPLWELLSRNTASPRPHPLYPCV